MTAPISTGKQISLDLTTLLGTITKANGYRTDIGTRVSRGKSQLDEKSVPLSIIVEGEETQVARQSDRSTNFKQRADYRIEGFDTCDLDNPNDISHDIVADLKKCLFAKDAINKTYNVEYLGRTIGKREEGLKINGGALHIAITYAEDMANL